MSGQHFPLMNGATVPIRLTYAVLGVEEDGTPPEGFFPVVEDFMGEGGSLDWPQAIVQGREPDFRPG